MSFDIEEISSDVLVEQHIQGDVGHAKYLAQNIVENVTDKFGKRSSSTCDVRLFPGLVDPTNKSSGRNFVRVHREVMAAASPLFRKLIVDLDPYQTKDLDVSIPDVSNADLQALVVFLYCGKVFQSKLCCETIATWLAILEIRADADMFSVGGGEGEALIESNGEVSVQKKQKRSCKLDCKKCGKVLKSRKALEAHIRQHNGQLLKCSECDKAFLHDSDLKDHMNVHAEESIRNKYYCQTCAKAFDTKKQLYNHRDAHRLAVEPCPYCDKKLKNRATLRSHVKEHLKEKVHKCDECGYSSKRATDLEIHQRKHYGDNPHTCNLCNLRFRLRSGLTKHRCSVEPDDAMDLQEDREVINAAQTAELSQQQQEFILISQAMEELAGEVVVEFEFQDG